MSSASQSIVPAAKAGELVAVASAALAPAHAINRITPYRVVEGWDGRQRTTIYYFARFAAKVSDRQPPHFSAMIVIPADKRTFTLQWFPHAEAAQVVVDLPIDRLPEAVADLKGVGF